MWTRIGELWCRMMHRNAMWPMHGKYICQQCLREYPVAWEGPASAAEYADPNLRGQTVELTAPVSAVQQIG
jgi:hypothetical protein